MKIDESSPSEAETDFSHNGSLRRKKLILFGASKAGDSALHAYLEKGHDIVAFSDNNKALHYTKKEGIIILPPEQLSSVDFDQIVICSQYWLEIYQQLTTHLAFNKNRVVVVNSSELKSTTFENPSIMSQARLALRWILNNFNQSAHPYYLDGGTLLGLARSGDLIPWDNDIDISILKQDSEFYGELLENSLTDLILNTGSRWKLEHLLYESSDKAWKEGELRKIIIRNEDFKFNIAIIVRYHNAPHYCYSAVSCIFSDHERHFTQNEWLDFYDVRASVPYDYKSFLDNTYGNWETEVREWSYTDYKNTDFHKGDKCG